MSRTAPSLTALVVLLAAASSLHAQNPADDRASLVARLERLIATGEPRHTNHDEGQQLQLDVDAAIARGEDEIERLAVRAAAPIVIRIEHPISSSREPPGLVVDATTILRVPRPVPWQATILVSVDGHPFRQLWTLRSGQRSGGRVDVGLPAIASKPGIHHLRVRAVLHFSKGSGDPDAWTESRDLRDCSYALYDADITDSTDARRFIYAPTLVSAQSLDPDLPDETYAVWLNRVLTERRNSGSPPPDWLPAFCDERTIEPDALSRMATICSRMYFEVRGGIGQIWIRTGRIENSAGRLEWIPERPVLEAVTMDQGGEVTRLSELAALLDADPSARPKGDVTVSPDDIVLNPPNPRPGEETAVTVTLRNVGGGALQKVEVYVAVAVQRLQRPPSRTFVIDIPKYGSSAVRLNVVFPAGYGIVLVHAMQEGEHSPLSTFTFDETPFDACTFRVVNRASAPAGFVESLEEASGCTGR